MQKRYNNKSSNRRQHNDTECNFVQSVMYRCSTQFLLAAQLRCGVSHAPRSVFLYVKDHSGCFLQAYNVLLLLLLLFLLALIPMVE
jgi:hypothetical protein